MNILGRKENERQETNNVIRVNKHSTSRSTVAYIHTTLPQPTGNCSMVKRALPGLDREFPKQPPYALGKKTCKPKTRKGVLEERKFRQIKEMKSLFAYGLKPDFNWLNGNVLRVDYRKGKKAVTGKKIPIKSYFAILLENGMIKCEGLAQDRSETYAEPYTDHKLLQYFAKKEQQLTFGAVSGFTKFVAEYHFKKPRNQGAWHRVHYKNDKRAINHYRELKNTGLQKLAAFAEFEAVGTLKDGIKTLKTLTARYFSGEQRQTKKHMLMVALVRLRLAKGLPPFPDHMLLEDSSFKAMPATFLKPGCKLTNKGFEIPPGGLPTDKLAIKRMENKQRQDRRERNLKRLKNELVAMCVPEYLQDGVREKKGLDAITAEYISKCLGALPSVSRAVENRIATIIINSNVVVPKCMADPAPILPDHRLPIPSASGGAYALPDDRGVVVGNVVEGVKQAGSPVLPLQSAGDGEASKSAPEPKNIGGLDILLSTITSYVLQDDGSAQINRGHEGSSSFGGKVSSSGRKREYDICKDIDTTFAKISAQAKRQKHLKKICEQHRRDGLKEEWEALKALALKALTPEFLAQKVQKRVSRRGPTKMQIFMVALVRLRLAKGLPPFPDHMLLEDSSFIAMPATFLKPGCQTTENGFEIPPGGFPKDKSGIMRTENKQRGDRRRRNLQRLENELVTMCMPLKGKFVVRKKEILNCVARYLSALPPVSLAEKIRISSIIENSQVLIPKGMGKPKRAEVMGFKESI